MGYATVVLKGKRTEAVGERSPWIFSGAIAEARDFERDGQLCRVVHNGAVVATGYLNTRTTIAVRVLVYGEESIDQGFLRSRMEAAWAMRKALLGDCSDSCRIINGEGDDLPGLVVDKYGDYLVVQSSTAGMDLLLEDIVAVLVAMFRPRGIYEKSRSSARAPEGVPPRAGILHGAVPPEVEIREHGMRFVVDIPEGQKTGFFLDQRENRQIMAAHAAGRTALNCYCYSAAIGVALRRAGVATLHNVDISQSALALAARNYGLNGIVPADDEFRLADVKEYLEVMPRDYYDLIILDPPKFTATRRTVETAIKGYKHINMAALRRIRSGGLLFTFSCSGLIDTELFRKIIFYGAKDAGRSVRVVKSLSADLDHPASIYHRESEYLKGLMLYVD